MSIELLFDSYFDNLIKIILDLTLSCEKASDANIIL